EPELGSHALAVELEATEVDPLPRGGTGLVDADLADALARGVVGEVHGPTAAEVGGLHAVGPVPADRRQVRHGGHAAVGVVGVGVAVDTGSVSRGAGGQEAIAAGGGVVAVVPRPAAARRGVLHLQDVADRIVEVLLGVRAQA